MSEFKKYRRTNIAEMRSATQEDFSNPNSISVSEADTDEVADLFEGKVEKVGMIARNPKNYSDQWYVAKKYFEDNFEIIPDYLLFKYEE